MEGRVACAHTKPVPLWEPTHNAKVYRFGVWCQQCWQELPLARMEEGLQRLKRHYGVSEYHLELLRDCLGTRT